MLVCLIEVVCLPLGSVPGPVPESTAAEGWSVIENNISMHQLKSNECRTTRMGWSAQPLGETRRDARMMYFGFQSEKRITYRRTMPQTRPDTICEVGFWLVVRCKRDGVKSDGSQFE